MPTQQQVLAAAGDDLDYVRAGERLAIPPGQAYLIATGRPADSSEAFPPGLPRPGLRKGSTQDLLFGGIPVINPVQTPEVRDWIERQAAAAAARSAAPGPG